MVYHLLFLVYGGAYCLFLSFYVSWIKWSPYSISLKVASLSRCSFLWLFICISHGAINIFVMRYPNQICNGNVLMSHINGIVNSYVAYKFCGRCDLHQHSKSCWYCKVRHFPGKFNRLSVIPYNLYGWFNSKVSTQSAEISQHFECREDTQISREPINDITRT